MRSKLQRLMDDQENRDEEEYQEYVQERIKTVVAVLLPYEKGTTEYWNAIEHLKEWSHTNHDEIMIEECQTCDECGTMNRTVGLRMNVPMGNGNKKNLYLCDYCARGLE